MSTGIIALTGLGLGLAIIIHVYTLCLCEFTSILLLAAFLCSWDGTARQSDAVCRGLPRLSGQDSLPERHAQSASKLPATELRHWPQRGGDYGSVETSITFNLSLSLYLVLYLVLYLLLCFFLSSSPCVAQLWEVDPAKHKPGQVEHTVGWPLVSVHAQPLQLLLCACN